PHSGTATLTGGLPAWDSPATPRGRVHHEPRDRLPDAAARVEPLRRKHDLRPADFANHTLRPTLYRDDARWPPDRDLRSNGLPRSRLCFERTRLLCALPGAQDSN